MSGSLFYDLKLIDQLAVNVFYGMGYNFYRLENQLRADDQKVRAHISHSLSTTRSLVEQAQSAYRRKYLPPPTRAKPSADPEAVEAAAGLERLCSRIGQLEATIRTLPVPGNDRMTQRYRQEAPTLVALMQCDQRLVGQAEWLRTTMQNKDYAWMLSNASDLADALTMMTQGVQDRQSLLQ